MYVMLHMHSPKAGRPDFQEWIYKASAAEAGPGTTLPQPMHGYSHAHGPGAAPMLRAGSSLGLGALGAVALAATVGPAPGHHGAHHKGPATGRLSHSGLIMPVPPDRLGSNASQKQLVAGPGAPAGAGLQAPAAPGTAPAGAAGGRHPKNNLASLKHINRSRAFKSFDELAMAPGDLEVMVEDTFEKGGMRDVSVSGGGGDDSLGPATKGDNSQGDIDASLLDGLDELEKAMLGVQPSPPLPPTMLAPPAPHHSPGAGPGGLLAPTPPSSGRPTDVASGHVGHVVHGSMRVRKGVNFSTDQLEPASGSEGGAAGAGAAAGGGSGGSGSGGKENTRPRLELVAHPVLGETVMVPRVSETGWQATCSTQWHP